MSNNFTLYTPVVLSDDEWASGAFGKVYVVDTPSGKIAVKSVPELKGHVNRELETCKQLASENHPNIMQLLGYWIENTTLFLVMEFMPETLNSLFERLLLAKMRMKMSLMNHLIGDDLNTLEFVLNSGLSSSVSLESKDIFQTFEIKSSNIGHLNTPNISHLNLSTIE